MIPGPFNRCPFVAHSGHPRAAVLIAHYRQIVTFARIAGGLQIAALPGGRNFD